MNSVSSGLSFSTTLAIHDSIAVKHFPGSAMLVLKRSVSMANRLEYCLNKSGVVRLYCKIIGTERSVVLHQNK